MTERAFAHRRRQVAGVACVPSTGMRGERNGREQPERPALDGEHDRPSPGKVTSTQRLGGQGQQSYRVAPGKRTLTMSLPSAAAQSKQ